jgi:hypothetical protein
MISRSQGLKLLRTPMLLFLMIVDKGGEDWIKASRFYLKVLGVERISRVYVVSL